MSWLFSRALAEVFSEDTSSDGEPSALSSGNPTPQAYCAPDKMMAFSRLSRYGMMFKPLTETRGEELLTLYREAFLAPTLVQQEKAQELMEKPLECGEKWRGSFTKYDPDLSLWKTPQCSLLGDSEEFLETWPQWGLMRDGECWEQRTLEQTIRGTGYGLSEKLPTPQATDHRSKPTSASWKAKGGMNFSLANPEIQMWWRTPTAHEWKNTGHSTQIHLSDQVRPQQVKNPKKAAMMWPTPVKSDHAGRRPSEGWAGTGLPSMVWRKTGGTENPQMSPAQLHATWVEWLMGWPLGWTDLKPLVTDKFPSVQQPPGGC